MKRYLVETKPHSHRGCLGAQRIYKFPNGWGASVVPEYKISTSNTVSKPVTGLWEVAILDADGNLCYDTAITDDVVRNLNDPEVDNLLGQVSRLLVDGTST
jgi:hypothetical protein